MSLLIVILNYKTAQLTIDCLESLVNEVKALPSTEVVVVDNASGDGSGEKILGAIEQNRWQEWVKLLASDNNGGYAAGNNLAIRPALDGPTPPDYILLLNPDTVVRPGAIKELVDFMNEHPGAGIAGSRLEDPDGTAQYSAFRFPTLGGELEATLRLGLASKVLSRYKIAPPISDSACQTHWVAGASMIVRRAVFEKIGLLDEEYFMYYEELDFCLQAHRAGWECWYVPASRVVHLVGQSSGVTLTKEQPKRRPLYWFDSRRRFFLKNHGQFYLWMANLLWIVGFSLWRVRRGIQRKPDLDPPYLLLDFIKYASGRGPSAPSEKLGLLQQIKEDWIAHGRDWTKPGFRAVAVQRFGQWRMKVEPKLLRAPLSIIYRFFYRHVRNVYGIDLPYTVKLGRRVIIEHQSAIIVHGYSQIGDDCILRQGVTLGNRYLDRPFEAPKLGKKVNVGAGAKLLGGLAIGDNVNIGANAVVLRDIPDGHTAIGIPAKVIPPKIKAIAGSHGQ